MYLNAPGTSTILLLLVAAQLIDVFQLVVETQEIELIQTMSLLVQAVVAGNSNTKTKRGLWGCLTIFKIVLLSCFISFVGDQQGCLTILNLICITSFIIA